MTKVKICTTTRQSFGKVVNFGGIDLKFDHLGYTEVESQEIADQLTEKYTGMLFIGEAPVKTLPKPDKGAEDYKALFEAHERVKVILADREATIASLKEEIKVWKDQVDIIKAKHDTLEAKLAEFTVGTKVEKEIDETRVQLAGKTIKELIAVCIGMEMDPAKFDSLKKKDDFINLIIEEVRKS